MSQSAAEILPSTFNRRITVKQAIASTDATGGTSTSGYTPLFTTWADVDNMKTSAKIYYGLDAFASVYTVKFRYTNSRNISTGMLIDYLDGGTTITMRILSTTLTYEWYKKFMTCMAQVVEPS